MPRTKTTARKPTARFEKNVKDIVREELKEEIERKKALVSYDNITLNSAIPSGDVASSMNYMRILGPIDQVSYALPTATAGEQGGYNFRVGDEISLKDVDIKGFVSYADLTINQQINTRIGVRVMILRQRDENTDVGFVANSHADKLLMNGELSVPGPGSFSGRPLNLIQEINRDLYAVRYDKTFYLNQSLQINGTTNVNRSTGGTEHTLKFFQHKLTFGKGGLKLKYTDGNSDTPNNFPYVLVVGYTNLVDDAAAGNNQINITMSSVATYTDA